MPSALRRLGVFLFCLGSIVAVAGVLPVLATWVAERAQQVWLGVAVVGGLLAASGLIVNWLGSQVLREEAAQPGEAKMLSEQHRATRTTQAPPPAMRLSSAPKRPAEYREDLMA